MNNDIQIRQFVKLRADLKSERERLQERLLELDSCLAHRPEPKPRAEPALTSPSQTRQGGAAPQSRRKRKMTPEAKARIAFGQRRRWARQKAALKGRP